MSECTHDCSTCSENCAERTEQSLLAPQNEASHIQKVIGIVSGKGGVGKSLVTSLLAAGMQKKGKSVGILDADITGPSIPKMFGLSERLISDGTYIHPAVTKNGTKVVSMNLLLERDSDPVVWRGPIIAGVIKQFWSDVCWDQVDYMFVDMPPGTGDVPLTVFQSLPVDGIVIVASPQELVSMIVEKAARMAALMDIPVIALVENMAYYVCPDCGKKHAIFGETNPQELADNYGIDTVCELPINPDFAQKCDQGQVEDIDSSIVDNVLERILEIK